MPVSLIYTDPAEISWDPLKDAKFKLPLVLRDIVRAQGGHSYGYSGMITDQQIWTQRDPEHKSKDTL